MTNKMICLLFLSFTATCNAARNLLFPSHSPFVSSVHRDEKLSAPLPFINPENTEYWTSDVHDSEHGTSITFRLMHRNSPHSPFQNPNASFHETLMERLSRDAAHATALSYRAQWAAAATNNSLYTQLTSSSRHAAVIGPITSGMAQGSGEYFTRLGIGTPSRGTYMVVDTGSDVMWLQCAPCRYCYPQSDPLFDPALSSSFRRLSCKSRLCGMLEFHGCEGKSGLCMYAVAYGDGSFTTGKFSTETISFSGAEVTGVGFGCGHDNEGLFVGAAGLFGLGRGPLSFPSQAAAQVGRIFSYCLAGTTSRALSTLVFGKTAVPERTVFTPLLKNPNLETFYYVGLVGISIRGTRLDIPATMFELDASGNGGVIIDSGTSVSRLVQHAYVPFRGAFTAAMRGIPTAAAVWLFDTCYDLSGRHSVRVPSVVLHFHGGADLELAPSNLLIPVDTSGTHCLAFATSPGRLSIIGNIQQEGFRVVFDGRSSRVGFAANQC